MIAATSVPNEMKQSFNASSQLAIKLHEFSFSQCLFTYLHKKNFVIIAATTTMIV
ncbi:hypothetical protein J5751_04185 [bacterium]|nr:hypothetical protein [bacterium]